MIRPRLMTVPWDGSRPASAGAVANAPSARAPDAPRSIARRVVDSAANRSFAWSLMARVPPGSMVWVSRRRRKDVEDGPSRPPRHARAILTVPSPDRKPRPCRSLGTDSSDREPQSHSSRHVGMVSRKCPEVPKLPLASFGHAAMREAWNHRVLVNRPRLPSASFGHEVVPTIPGRACLPKSPRPPEIPLASFGREAGVGELASFRHRARGGKLASFGREAGVGRLASFGRRRILACRGRWSWPASGQVEATE